MGPAGARLRQQYVAEPTVDDGERFEAERGEEEPESEPESSPAPSRGRAKPTAAAPTPPLPAAAATRAAPPMTRSPTPPPAIEAPEPRPVVVERQEMLKGYEFEKGQYVLFTPAELQALKEASRDSIDIVAFVPLGAVDPLYYDKAYLLAPDKRGEKTYSLLLAALERSGRSALAKWAWRGKQVVVQVRPAEGGLVMQQLLYADEVRPLADLDIRRVPVSEAELALAVKLIEQGAQDAYDPSQFVDEEKQRILAAVERKIAGKEIVSHEAPALPQPAGRVIDLMEALRASLAPAAKAKAASPSTKARKPARTTAPAGDGPLRARRGR
jgi:DNA end-binding protein Ku